MKIIGILGYKGSGKDTAAQVLLEQGYVKFAFADSLKDVMSTIFGWPRHMMEGDTRESREWREQPDLWWSARLNKPNFTPRIAMTEVGNDVLKQFHNEIWIANMEYKLSQCAYDKVVITDCRFVGECNLIKKMGGNLMRINKGQEPPFAKYSNLLGHSCSEIREDARHVLKTQFAHIHESEWAWNHVPVDTVINNAGSIPELHQSVMAALSK